MKTKLLILIFSFLILTACGTSKPITTVHHERIEERLKPVVLGADTIEITLSRDAACCVRSPSRSKNNVLNKRANARQDTARCVPTIRSIASTRGVSMQTTHTDTTQTLRITLKPDTIFVPYVHHIRSDTIVVPDRICNEKLKQTKFMNVILLIFLILFVATIIYRKIFHK